MSDTNSPPPDDPDGAAPGGPGGPGHPGPPMAGPAWTPPRRPRPQAGGGPRPRHPGAADGAVAGRRGGPGQELGAVPAPLAPGGAVPGRRPGGPPGGAGGGRLPALAPAADGPSRNPWTPCSLSDNAYTGCGMGISRGPEPGTSCVGTGHAETL